MFSLFTEEEEDLGPKGSDEDEDIPLHITENGKIESKAKPDASKGKAVKTESSDKAKVTVVEPKKKKMIESDEDDETDEDEDESDDNKVIRKEWIDLWCLFISIFCDRLETLFLSTDYGFVMLFCEALYIIFYFMNCNGR